MGIQLTSNKPFGKGKENLYCGPWCDVTCHHASPFSHNVSIFGPCRGYSVGSKLQVLDLEDINGPHDIMQKLPWVQIMLCRIPPPTYIRNLVVGLYALYLGPFLEVLVIPT